MNTVIEGNSANFDALTLSATTPVVIDFYANWCGPCRSFSPVLDKVVGELNGRVTAIKVDIDQYPALARRYKVQSIPSIKVLKNGQVFDETVGFLPEQALRKLIEKAL